MVEQVLCWDVDGMVGWLVGVNAWVILLSILSHGQSICAAAARTFRYLKDCACHRPVIGPAHPMSIISLTALGADDRVLLPVQLHAPILLVIGWMLH